MIDLSIIVPFYNEEGSIEHLVKKVTETLNNLPYQYELVLVNDGSVDNTPNILDKLASMDSRVKVVHFAKNYGQTSAMMAGIDYAQGNIIIAMDGDGQNDPHDIPKLIEQIDMGYDVVSGWRKFRQDRALNRKFPSYIANKIISWVSGVKLNDYGCSLKAYRRDIIKNVRLYGEMHRFIPIYAHWFGARVTEVPVNHFARTTGVSKYGINRTAKVILDLLVVKFLQRYLSKPIYIIGGFGLMCIAAGAMSFFYATYLKIFEGISYIQTPLLLLTVMAVLMGFLSVLIGLVCEILVRTYYESQNKKPYFVKYTQNIADPYKNISQDFRIHGTRDSL